MAFTAGIRSSFLFQFMACHFHEQGDMLEHSFTVMEMQRQANRACGIKKD